MNWETIIRHYQKCHLPIHNEEMEWFVQQETLANAIRKAAIAEDHRGKRYRHQHRIPKRLLVTSLKKLRNKETTIRACKSFDELHTLIKRTLDNISGIGELYCYDTALRIGAKLNLHPEAVLLHAGTRKGASFIADVRGRDRLGLDCLPLELQHLPPEQVEDILCIYKDGIKETFGSMSRKGSFPHTPPPLNRK